MRIFRTKAFILGSKSYRESDRMVSLYTSDYGKLEVLGRGQRKLTSKLAPLLEAPNLVDAMIIRGKKHDIFGSGMILDGYKDLKNNYALFMTAQLGGALLNDLTMVGEVGNNFFVQFGGFLRALRGVAINSNTAERNAIPADAVPAPIPYSQNSQREPHKGLEELLAGFRNMVVEQSGWAAGNAADLPSSVRIQTLSQYIS